MRRHKNIPRWSARIISKTRILPIEMRMTRNGTSQSKAAAGSHRQSAKPVVYSSDPALHEGAEAHVIEGVPVQIYNPSKIVADRFKFRRKIGLDGAFEALREVSRARRATMNDLERYPRVDRVARVTPPYLASLT